MKEYIIIIVVLLLTFVPNYFFREYLEKSGEGLIKLIEQMEEKLKNGEEIKQEDAKKLKDSFLEREKIWILMVDHDMLDEIENSIEDCVAFYHEDYSGDFEASANRIKDAVHDLAKREEISLANIL